MFGNTKGAECVTSSMSQCDSYAPYISDKLAKTFKTKPTVEILVNIAETQRKMEQRLSDLYNQIGFASPKDRVMFDIETRKLQAAISKYNGMYSVSLYLHLMDDEEFAVWQYNNNVVPTQPAAASKPQPDPRSTLGQAMSGARTAGVSVKSELISDGELEASLSDLFSEEEANKERVSRARKLVQDSKKDQGV